MDMAQAGAYHQVPIRECDKRLSEKTAFRTSDGGLWQYTVAPFGLVNLPALFSRLMHDVLGLGDTLDKYSAVYIDDMLVYDHTIGAHIAHIREVLKRIQAGGMCVARHKCLFFHKEIKFLGHIVGANGVRPDPEKVKAMRDMSNPVKYGRADKKLVQTVLGCFNYYCRYVRNFAALARRY